MADEHSFDLFDDAAEASEDGTDDGPTETPPTSEPAEPDERVWSVAQVNKAVRVLLEGSVDALWVGGEVTGWTRARSGHCYFTLKDDRAQLRCVMWEREARGLPLDPDEGMRVKVFGSLTLYEARGAYQLSVQRVEDEGGEGLWRLAFEKLRQKLEAEGLLEAHLKKPLPRYPSCVGIVTSPTGAALHDILTVLRRRAPWVRVVLAGAKVQGDGAADEIARALLALAASGAPDVIIVGRGGGSVEDLWAFNEEPVARAIARCDIPVVSAVGHEVDVTISDLVADLRAPTPSAAAEAVVPDGQALAAQLRGIPERLGRGLRTSVEVRRRRVSEHLQALSRSMERRLQPARQSVDLFSERLERGMQRLVTDRRQQLGAAAGRLEALSPLATLERGYAVARTVEGAVLRTVSDFPDGREFVLRVQDGSVICEARQQSSRTQSDGEGPSEEGT